MLGMDVHARSTHAAAIELAERASCDRARFGPGTEEVLALARLSWPQPVRAAYEAGPTGLG